LPFDLLSHWLGKSINGMPIIAIISGSNHVKVHEDARPKLKLKIPPPMYFHVPKIHVVEMLIIFFNISRYASLCDLFFGLL
jgi:hypothetical protein